MPIPAGTPENSTTTAAAWKKVLATGAHPYRSGTTLRDKESADTGEAIRVAIVPAGSAAPSDADPDNDTMYLVYGGQTYPLDNYADYKTDVYVRGAADGVAHYRAWSVVN